MLRPHRMRQWESDVTATEFNSDVKPTEEEADSTPRSLSGLIWHRVKWIMLTLLGFVFLVHFYALWTGLLQPPVTANMVGSMITGQSLSYDPVPLERISPNLVYAVIAAEDSKFCQHNGLDLEAIKKAIAERKAGKRLRGASTISQQTAKNVFLWNGGGFVRKGIEAWMTLVIEHAWNKQRIMEVYLNVAEWGDGIYGAEAAAQTRFGKSAADLSTREAALLAAVLPNPNAWRVDPPGNYVAGRANTLQQRLAIVKRDGLADCVFPDN